MLWCSTGMNLAAFGLEAAANSESSALSFLLRIAEVGCLSDYQEATKKVVEELKGVDGAARTQVSLHWGLVRGPSLFSKAGERFLQI